MKLGLEGKTAVVTGGSLGIGRAIAEALAAEGVRVAIVARTAATLEQGLGLLLITHDLGVVAEVAQRVLVMYAGQVVESAGVPELFVRPRHPYTEALLAALPEHNLGRRRLRSMSGMVPGAYDRPPGCLMAPRCIHVQSRCRSERPALTGEPQALARCFYPLPSDPPGPA